MLKTDPKPAHSVSPILLPGSDRPTIKDHFQYLIFQIQKTELIFKGKLLPAELTEFLNLKNVSKAGGSIDLDLKFSGRPGKKDSYKFTDVFNLNSQSEAVFNSVGISFEDKQIDISDVNGSFIMNESTTTDNFRLTLNKQKICTFREIHEFPGLACRKSC